MNAQRILMSDLVPIDLAEQYRLSVWLRQPAGGLHSYLLVSCFDAAGNALDGGTFPGVGWSTGTFHYWGLVDALIPASFTHYSTTFGPNTERQLPSQTRYIKIGGLFPYVTGTVGPSTIQVQAYLLVKLTTQVFRQSAAPAHVAGRLWQDTDDGRIYRSDGSSWVQITAADALLLVNAPAQAGADVTALNADDIIFRQAAAPSSAQIGWLWLDTDDLRFYRYNGAFWVQIGSDDARNLSAGAPAEAGADATAGHADDIIFRQSTAPAGAQVGWLWIDTDDLRVYRFNGSIWVQIGSNDVQGLDNVGDLASEDSVDTVHIDLEAATEVVQTTDASTVASANNASVLSETSPASIVVDEDTDVYEVVGQGLSQVTTSGGPGSPEANLLLRYQLNGGGYVNPMGGGFIGRTMNTIVPFMLTGVVTGFDPGDDVDFAVQVAAAEIGGGGTVTHTVTNATIVVTKVKR
jgi:hypothetical protein